MKALLTATTVLLASAYLLGTAAAQGGPPGPPPGGGGGGDVVSVDCVAGDTIQEALKNAADGVTIEVSGTCTEIVTVTTDGITILGQGLISSLTRLFWPSDWSR